MDEMNEIEELQKQLSDAMGKRVDAQFEIKNLMTRLYELEQNDFIPGWFVHREWDDENELTIEWIDRRDVYDWRVARAEFIQRYEACKHLFEQAPKEATK